MSATMSKSAEQDRRVNQWPGFWAMVRKELKQNADWSVIILALICLIVFLNTASSIPQGTPQSAVREIIERSLWKSTTPIFFLIGPFVAFYLGVQQIISEQRRDLWAFLVNRPASRSTIFYGKAMASLILFTFSILIPLTAVTFASMTSIQLQDVSRWHQILTVAPYLPESILFYFAAILTALRPARWWGSRCLPIAVATTLIALLGNQPLSLKEILLLLAAIIMFAIAAHQSFICDGVYTSQTRFGKMSLGGILFAGLGVLVTLLLILNKTIVDQIYLHDTMVLIANTRAGYREYQYAISQADQIVVITYSKTDQMVTMRSLSGKPVRLSSDELRRAEYQILPKWPLAGNPLDQLSTIPAEINLSPYPSSMLINPQQWSYSQNLREIINSSAYSAHQIEVLAPNGFFPGADPGAKRFPAPLEHLVVSSIRTSLLAFPNALYYANLQEHIVRRLDFIPPDQPIRRLITFPQYDLLLQKNRGVSVTYSVGDIFLALTDQRLLLISPQGGLITSLSVPAHALAPAFSADFADQHFFFWYAMPYHRSISFLNEYNGQGQLMKQTKLPTLPATILLGPASSRQIVYSHHSYYSLSGILIPPCLVEFIEFPSTSPVLLPLIDNGNIRNGRGLDLPNEFWISMVLASAFASLFAFLIARRCAYTQYGTWVWATGVFFLGLPGVLLLLSLREWPAREICPNCHRKRVVTRELCEHCGAPFAPVEQKGTEIFEDAEVRQGVLA